MSQLFQQKEVTNQIQRWCDVAQNDFLDISDSQFKALTDQLTDLLENNKTNLPIMPMHIYSHSDIILCHSKKCQDLDELWLAWLMERVAD